jgi:DNA-binding Lrp family transcriptional regulator
MSGKMETRQETADRLGISVEQLGEEVERLKGEAGERYSAALTETIAAAIDLGTIRGIERGHEEEAAQSETVIDGIEALMSAIFAATGERYVLSRIKQYADGWDYSGPARFIEPDGLVGGVTIADEGRWQAFTGSPPMFVREEGAPPIESAEAAS